MTEELNTSRTTDRSLVDEMKESYLRFAMSVIISRALPDVRDGLKPSQRRVLYSMHDLGLNPGGQTRKCATIVGTCMGKYHPHGDASIYDTLVRMAQDWASRYSRQLRLPCYCLHPRIKVRPVTIEISGLNPFTCFMASHLPSPGFIHSVTISMRVRCRTAG